MLALIAAYLAVFRDWTPYLSPGERAHVVIIAADRRQAQCIFRYLKAFLSIPLFGDLIERETQEVLDLRNMVSVEVMTANFKTVRGRTVVAALLDELAFWPTDEELANPDSEIIGALRPAMSTVPGAMMLEGVEPTRQEGRAVRGLQEELRARQQPARLAGRHADHEPHGPAVVHRRRDGEGPRACRR